MSEAENDDDKRRRAAHEARIRAAAKRHKLTFSRGRGSAMSPEKGLYRLKDVTGAVAFKSYDLSALGEYLIKRAAQIRGGHGAAPTREDTTP
jgi:hypothetical protein